KRFFALLVSGLVSGKEAVEFLPVGDPVDADIDHGSSRLHVVAGNNAGPANRRHQDVGAAANFRQIARLRVADGDGGVLIQQQHGDRLAHNVAASDYHGFLPGDRNLAALQNLHDAGRRAGHQSWTLRRKVAHVHGMESVYVFGGIDRQQNLLGIDVRGQRQLNQDAVDFVAAVQAGDEGEQFFGSHAFGGRVLFAVEADFLGTL